MGTDHPRKGTRAGASPKNVQAHGWTIFFHPCALAEFEGRVKQVAAELRGNPDAQPSGNRKLLAHLMDLAFNKIPSNPLDPMFRHGGTLEGDRRHWYRGKTGAGRYRLFFRFRSSEKLIVYGWVNDEDSLRTYGSNTDAYVEFAKRLDKGRPPDDWDDLVKEASSKKARQRTRNLSDFIRRLEP